MYQWPSRTRRSSSSSAIHTANPGAPRLAPPARPATTTPTRPPRRLPSFGAAVIHTTPPPRSPAQLRATLDPARIGPTRMPSYVGSLLDAFTIDSIGEASLDLDRSFEVSPRMSYRSAPPPERDPSTTTISEADESHHSAGALERPFEGLQLSLSLPERPFSMGSMMPEFAAPARPRSPSPPPSRSRTPTTTARARIRLDSMAFEKPPQSFASAAGPPPTRHRRRSCILDCVRRSMKKAATRKGVPSD